MIILARYCRWWRMKKTTQQEKQLKYRNLYLFDEVYWLNRDHCRIEWVQRKMKSNRWYIIRWDKQNYIDQRWENKISIIPKWRLLILPNHRIKILWYNQTQLYDMWRGTIFKPLRRLYNIYIKNSIYRYLYIRRLRNGKKQFIV
jgi:hypothetical protein